MANSCIVQHKRSHCLNKCNLIVYLTAQQTSMFNLEATSAHNAVRILVLCITKGLRSEKKPKLNL